MAEERNKAASVKENWQSLSPKDQDSLMFCFGSDLQKEAGPDFLIDFAKMTPQKIEEWINEGILEKGSLKKFAQEWLDANQTRVFEIERKRAELGTRPSIPKPYFSEGDQEFLTQLDNRKRIIQFKEDPTRYRISGEFHNFVKSQLTNEKEE